MKVSTSLCNSVLLLASISYAAKFKVSSSDGNSTNTEIHPKCFKAEYKIRTAGELAIISDCAVISGSVHITDFDSDVLYMGSIEEVKGDLTVTNSSRLLRMDAPELTSVGGVLELNTLNSLTTLSFPRLESVETMKWQVLPILTFVNFESGIKSINSVIMSDTSLTGFGGFNVETLKTLNINNNRFLERIESTVSEVTEELLIAANADNLKVSLPNLVWVKQMTIKDTEEVNLESLQIIEKSADFSHNKFQDLDLSSLKSTGNTLSIIKNKNLKKVNFDKLSEVGGGLMIIDNTHVEDIDFFPSLRSVGGAIEFHGNIKSNHFNGLKVIKGSAIMKSSSEEFDCSDWMKNEVARVVRGGKVECGSGKSSTTEVLLVDEDGESSQGEPGFNDNSNSSTKDRSIHQKSSASSTSYSVKLALVIAAYSFGMILQVL